MIRAIEKFAEYPRLHMILLRIWFVEKSILIKISLLETHFKNGKCSVRQFVLSGDELMDGLDNIDKLRYEISCYIGQ